MRHQKFQLTKDSAAKFWTVHLEDAAITIRFGRIGTQGQGQQKTFDSAALAEREYERLVREKVKKGYVETGADAVPNTGGPTKPAARSRTAKPKAPAGSSRPSEKPGRVTVDPLTRSIDLPPEEASLRLWRNDLALPMHKSPPFSLGSGLRRLRTVNIHHGRNESSLRWYDADVPISPSREEAQFWLLAFEQMQTQGVDGRAAAATLANVELDGKMSRERISGIQVEKEFNSLEHYFHCAYRLLEPGDFVPFVQEFLRRYADHCHVVYHDICEALSSVEHLRTFIVMIGDGEGGYKMAWPIMRLGDPALMAGEFRRLEALLEEPEQARLWLALTGYDALDVLAYSVVHQRGIYNDRDAAEKTKPLAQVLSRVVAPEAAPVALQIALETRVAAVGQAWLKEHPEHAVAGLTVAAMGSGKPAAAARKYLQRLAVDGSAPLLRAVAAHLSTDQAQFLEREIIGHAMSAASQPETALPAELQAAFAALKADKPTPWLSVGSLSPVEIPGGALPRHQLELLLAELHRVPLGGSSNLLACLKGCADVGSLDRFALSIFDQWLEAHMPPKEPWVLTGLALLGGDQSTARLADRVRDWPDENQHQRAKIGLDCLEAIGSDLALNIFKGLSLKHRWSYVRQRADEALRAIAKKRGMSSEELADHIVTDAGLDEKGSRVFDFGPRRFTLTLGRDLQPVLRDADGVVRKDLPAPVKSDDSRKALRAVEDWKSFKKILRETLRVQSRRLEDRMIHGRRWTPESFRRLILEHPLLVRLVQKVVLGVYDHAGQLQTSFCVIEDGTLADADDKACELPSKGKIGVMHPAQLAEATHAAWGEKLSDYGIVPPFSQIGRVVCRAEAGDLKRDAITRFAGRPVPPLHLFGTLEGDRWTRGEEDDSELVSHEKYFEAADQTAVIRYSGLQVFNVKQAPPQEIQNIRFLRGKFTYGWENKPDKVLQVQDVDAVVLSEALRVATAIVEAPAATA